MYACREGATEDDKDDKVITGVNQKDGMAPEPLLPNWGAANALAYKLDIQVRLPHSLIVWRSAI